MGAIGEASGVYTANSSSHSLAMVSTYGETYVQRWRACTGATCRHRIIKLRPCRHLHLPVSQLPLGVFVISSMDDANKFKVPSASQTCSPCLSAQCPVGLLQNARLDAYGSARAAATLQPALELLPTGPSYLHVCAHIE